MSSNDATNSSSSYHRSDPLDIPLIDNHILSHLLLPRIINSIKLAFPKVYLDWTTGTTTTQNDNNAEESSQDVSLSSLIRDSLFWKRIVENILRLCLLLGSCRHIYNSSSRRNNSSNSNGGLTSPHHHQQQHSRAIKKVQWMSPFFVKCKFGVLQYVLLKFVSSIFVMVLEMYGLYKEGDFTPRGGYLYICILTNLSQCWALYCLVFFYYALKNELGPIRPVGKFLSVKALVFFTWWQSLGISILFQMGMIPHYTTFDSNTMGDQIDGKEWSSEDVAKGLQDWLICIEMFCAAIVHTFVFPHTDYMEPLGIMNQRQNSTPNIGSRRLGRKGRLNRINRGLDDRSMCSKSSGETDNLIMGSGFDIELGDTAVVSAFNNGGGGCSTVDEMSDKESTCSSANIGGGETQPARHERQGFVRALLDSTVPRDVLDESVGIFKGKYNDEKKTLLHHAATSDEYDLFSKSSKRRKKVGSKLGTIASRKTKAKEGGASVPDSVLLND